MSRRREYIKENGVKTNYTTIFLLPMLDYDQGFYPKEFISAYISGEKDPDLILTFVNTGSPSLKEAVENLEKHSDYVSMDYDDDDKELVVVMRIPEDYKIDFNMFKIGRYSKFSNPLKEVLLDVHGRMTGSGKKIMMVDVLHPDHLAKKFWADKIGVSINDLPNGEVMSIPDLNVEIYSNVSSLYKTIGE